MPGTLPGTRSCPLQAAGGNTRHFGVHSCNQAAGPTFPGILAGLRRGLAWDVPTSGCWRLLLPLTAAVHGDGRGGQIHSKDCVCLWCAWGWEQPRETAWQNWHTCVE